jgi:hypothetical protein
MNFSGKIKSIKSVFILLPLVVLLPRVSRAQDKTEEAQRAVDRGGPSLFLQELI